MTTPFDALRSLAHAAVGPLGTSASGRSTTGRRAVAREFAAYPASRGVGLLAVPVPRRD